jgi:hypothetical protein
LYCTKILNAEKYKVITFSGARSIVVLVHWMHSASC